YKDHALHFGVFEGPPFYWNFRIVSHEIGTPCQESVANLGDIQYFLGPDDFYSFDGYNLQRVPNNMKEWFFATVDLYFNTTIMTRWDQRRNLVFWHFPSLNPPSGYAPGTVDTWISLNIRNGKWSKGTGIIE